MPQENSPEVPALTSSDDDELVHLHDNIAYPTSVSKELLHSLDDFAVRESDILLASYPKSGTHWIASIVKGLLRLCSSTPATFTSPAEFGDNSKFEELNAIEGTRVIPTHLPYRMLPKQFKEKSTKTIYVVRNPKDTAASFFHYHKTNPVLPTVERWDDFYGMYCEGNVVYGSWFEHVKEWAANPPSNVLVLFYEDMQVNLLQAVRQVAHFLDLAPSEDEVREVRSEATFGRMQKESQAAPSPEEKTVCSLTRNKKLIFRKGTVGDWKNHFTEQQSAEFDLLYSTRMDGTNLPIVFEL